MSNLYRLRHGPAAILDLVRAMSRVGNLEPQSGIYPDYPAPIVRQGAEGRELVAARWGMPTPPQHLISKKTGKPSKVDKGVTNIRNVKSPHWRRWLGVESRCLVPFSAFSEPPASGGSPSNWTWFALSEDQPLGFFAGVWTTWTSTRKLAEGPVTADLFGFLTTEPNGVVAPIHAKAMPVILTTPEEWETWLTAETPEALRLQRPLPDAELIRVAAPA